MSACIPVRANPWVPRGLVYMQSVCMQASLCMSVDVWYMYLTVTHLQGPQLLVYSPEYRHTNT